MIKYLMQFLLSIRTAVWLLCLLLVLLFAGAFVMPAEQAFQSIHSTPLLGWLAEQSLKVTWWLWGCIGVISVLALNTLFCSVESVIKKRKIERWLIIVAPQVVHIGFLLMLAAHLASSIGGYKSLAVALEGGMLYLPSGILQIDRINISVDPNGYMIDWSVDIDYKSEGVLRREVLMPNRPLFQDGTGVYVRDLRVFPRKEILLEVSREPGALWALVGGIFFTSGILLLVSLRMRRDHPAVTQ